MLELAGSLTLLDEDEELLTPGRIALGARGGTLRADVDEAIDSDGETGVRVRASLPSPFSSLFLFTPATTFSALWASCECLAHSSSRASLAKPINSAHSSLVISAIAASSSGAPFSCLEELLSRA